MHRLNSSFEKTCLAQGQMHKGQIVQRILAHADYHKLTTSTNCECRGADTRLYTCTLNHAWRRQIFLSVLTLTCSCVEKLPYSTSIASSICGCIDLVGQTRRYELLCKLQSLRLDIGNDDWMSARCTGSEKGGEADRTRAAYHHTTAKRKAGYSQGFEYNTEGFQKGTLCEAQIIREP